MYKSVVYETLYCIVLYCIVLYCIVLYCIVLYCIVLYCIVLYYEALYWRPIRPLSYRHSSGVVRNLHSTLAEWRIFNLRSMSPQGTHLLNARRRNSINSVFVEWHALLLPVSLEPSTFRLLESASRLLCSQSASNQWPFD